MTARICNKRKFLPFALALLVLLLGATPAGSSQHGRLGSNVLPASAFSAIIENPKIAAKEAVAARDFRFISIHFGWYSRRPGVQCFLTRKKEQLADFQIEVGDFRKPLFVDKTGRLVDRNHSDFRERMVSAAKSYNSSILEANNFPDPDICWPKDETTITLEPERESFLETLASENQFGPANKILTRFVNWQGNGANPSEKSDIVRASRFGHADAVDKMLRAGMPANSVGPWGLSALDWAIVRNHPEIVTLLVENGAELFRDRAGEGWLSHQAELSLRRFGTHEIHWAVLARNADILRTLVSKLFPREPACNGVRIAFVGIEKAILADWPAGAKELYTWIERHPTCGEIRKELEKLTEIAKRKNRTFILEWLEKIPG